MYNEDTVPLDITLPITAGGYVTKQYLIDAYPQLSDQVGSPGLWTWGDDSWGALGNNTNASHKSSPIQTICAGTNWKFVAGGAAGDLTIAIKTDGTLWIWGRGQFGALGDNTSGTSNAKSSPIQTVAGGTNWKLAACGLAFAAAIKTDGTLWTWGNNQYGQLGDNSNVSKSSPVQTVCGGTNWKSVDCGDDHTAAIKTDGTLWAWGRNTNGNIGDNSVTARSSPVQTVAGGTSWRVLSCGDLATNAIKTDGTLWAWGDNAYGQIGDNSITDKSSPVQTVSGGTNWKSVAGGRFHTAAIKTDGTLWAWGYNGGGGIGDNSVSHKSSPVQTVSGGTNWKSVDCGTYFTAAIKTDGTLWLWGTNSTGRLGDNTTANKSSPVQTVAGGTNWKSVGICGAKVVAIRDFDENF